MSELIRVDLVAVNCVHDDLELGLQLLLESRWVVSCGTPHGYPFLQFTDQSVDVDVFHLTAEHVKS